MTCTQGKQIICLQVFQTLSQRRNIVYMIVVFLKRSFGKC